MTALAWLIPAALMLGLLGLGAFLWALRDGQFDDLEGAGWRALDDPPAPGATPPPHAGHAVNVTGNVIGKDTGKIS